MSGPLAETDSVTYGINFSSTLNSLAYFHVANNQLPQDVMNILLEGVLPYTMKLTLMWNLSVYLPLMIGDEVPSDDNE